jgi:hypothetical protein
MSAATFTEVNARVLSIGCAFAACHAAVQPMGGLDLVTDPYSALMNGVSPISQQRYLVPGDPEASYVFVKLAKDAPGFGARMPPNAPLSDARLALVRSWIAAGAKRD